VLEIERIGGCAVWTIARPETKNALNLETIERMRLAISEASADPSLRAIILTGAGDAFASGGDLRELRGRTSADDAALLSDVGTDLCAALEGLPVPVIAALPGLAFGGGAELAIACDLRIADASAKIAFKQVRMGVTTAWGSIARLMSLVGRSGAARLLYTAHEIGAQEAKSLGLVDDVVADGTSRAAALAWARDVELGSPTAIAELKALLRSGAGERRRFVATWTSSDHTEAVNAFFERRAPKWSPRA
jgi:enoyl-CoA hydratase